MDQQHGTRSNLGQALQLQLVSIGGGHIVQLMAVVQLLQPVQLQQEGHEREGGRESEREGQPSTVTLCSLVMTSLTVVHLLRSSVCDELLALPSPQFRPMIMARAMGAMMQRVSLTSSRISPCWTGLCASASEPTEPTPDPGWLIAHQLIIFALGWPVNTAQQSSGRD